MQFDTHFDLFCAQNKDFGHLEVRLHYIRTGQVENLFTMYKAIMKPQEPTCEIASDSVYYSLKKLLLKTWHET